MRVMREDCGTHNIAIGRNSFIFVKRHTLVGLEILHYFLDARRWEEAFFGLRQVFVVAHGLSLGAVSGGYSSLRCAGFSLRWLLLLRSTGSRRVGFSSCGTRAQ